MEKSEPLVGLAFSNQSVCFDHLDKANKLTAHLRGVYRQELLREAAAGAKILEINCGTGIDSLYFANLGYQLHAIDIARGMTEQLNAKIKQHQRQGNCLKLTTQQLSYESLSGLGNRRFDYIISNFGGLNCTGDLKEVLQQFSAHLTETGKVTLVIMPKVSPWELLMVFKGKFKTAFRRFIKRPTAHIEGVHFPVFYYPPSYVIKAMKLQYKVLSLRGIYFAVPPEFYAGFVERYPRLFGMLQKIEKRLADKYPFNRWCDHYLITLQRRTAENTQQAEP